MLSIVVGLGRSGNGGQRPYRKDIWLNRQIFETVDL